MPPKNSNNKAAGSARPQTEVTDPPTPGPSRLTTQQRRDEDDAPSADTNADPDTNTNTRSNANPNVDAEADNGGESAQPGDTGDAPAASSSSVQLRRSARTPKKPTRDPNLVGHSLDSTISVSVPIKRKGGPGPGHGRGRRRESGGNNGGGEVDSAKRGGPRHHKANLAAAKLASAQPTLELVKLGDAVAYRTRAQMKARASAPSASAEPEAGPSRPRGRSHSRARSSPLSAPPNTRRARDASRVDQGGPEGGDGDGDVSNRSGDDTQNVAGPACPQTPQPGHPSSSITLSSAIIAGDQNYYNPGRTEDERQELVVGASDHTQLFGSSPINSQPATQSSGLSSLSSLDLGQLASSHAFRSPTQARQPVAGPSNIATSSFPHIPTRRQGSSRTTRKRQHTGNSDLDGGNTQTPSQSSSEGYSGRDKGKGKAIFPSLSSNTTSHKRLRVGSRSPVQSPHRGDVSRPIGLTHSQSRSGSGSYESPTSSGDGRERETVSGAEGRSDDDGDSSIDWGSQRSSQATAETESGNDGNDGQNATCGDVNVPNGNAAQTHTGIVEPSTFSQASQTTSDSDEDVESEEDEDEEEQENSTTDHSDVKSSEGLRGPSASQESTKPGFPPTNSSQTTSSDSTESSQSLLPYDEQTFETGGGGRQDVSSDESSLDVDPQADDGTFISPNASQGSGFEESQDASSTGNESGEGTSQEEGSGGQQSQTSQTSDDSESDLIVVATAREEPKKVAKSDG